MKRHPFLFVLSAIFTTGILLFSSIHAGAASSRGLAVPKSALPAELGPLDIKDYYAAVGIKAVGRIKSVMGHVVVFREDRKYAYYAASGDRVFERDVVYTLRGSRCRVQLDTSDVATMGENTRLMIKTYLDNRQIKVKSTTFAMNRGKAMFYALRLFKYRGASMEVETPTAVSGVRGTKWGIEVVELEGKPVASLPIQVADLSDAWFRHLAQANQPQFQTNIYSFEGSIRVTSTITGLTTMLSGGQGLNAGSAGLGNPFTTPPGVASQFQADTSAPGGGGSEIGGGSTGAGSNFPETSGSGTGSGSNLPDISSVTQNQNLSNLATATTRPTNHEGFFSGMLTNADSLSFDSKFMSTSVQNFDSNNAQAFNGINYVQVDGSGGNSKIVTALYFDPNFWTGSQPMQRAELGYNAYMEWGTWTQPNAMRNVETNYTFDNKGYYVWGDRTVTMPSTISGTYSGTAYGTDWSSAGGTDKTGTFSMGVNFAGGTGTINNFQVWVGGVNNTGMSSGTGSIEGSKFFVSSGTACVNGACGTGGASGYATGAFYGPNAQHAGGVWNVNNGLSGYANGVFQGSK
jgi:hypothetical protein